MSIDWEALEPGTRLRDYRDTYTVVAVHGEFAWLLRDGMRTPDTWNRKAAEDHLELVPEPFPEPPARLWIVQERTGQTWGTYESVGEAEACARSFHPHREMRVVEYRPVPTDPPRLATSWEPFKGTVREAGGGMVELYVDRDTQHYPPVGAYVTVDHVYESERAAEGSL